MRAIFCAVFLSLTSSVALAGMPGDGLMEEGLLQAAIEDVKKMSKSELAALAQPLSACASLDAFEGGLPRYYCHKELLIYRASGPQYKSIEALMAYYYIASRSILLKGKAGMMPNNEQFLMTYLTILDPLINASAIRSKELSRQEGQATVTRRG